jgi:hypothetical protein
VLKKKRGSPGEHFLRQAVRFKDLCRNRCAECSVFHVFQWEISAWDAQPSPPIT